MSFQHDRELGGPSAHRARRDVVGDPWGEALVELAVDVSVEEPAKPHVVDSDANWHNARNTLTRRETSREWDRQRVGFLSSA